MAIVKPVKLKKHDKYTLINGKGEEVWSAPVSKTVKVACIVDGHLDMMQVIGILTTVGVNMRENRSEAVDLFKVSFDDMFLEGKSISEIEALRDVVQSIATQKTVLFYPDNMDTNIKFASKRRLFDNDHDGYSYRLLVHCDGKSRFFFEVDACDFLFDEYIDEDDWVPFFTFDIESNRNEGMFMDVVRYEGSDEDWDGVVDD